MLATRRLGATFLRLDLTDIKYDKVIHANFTMNITKVTSLYFCKEFVDRYYRNKEGEDADTAR